MNLNDRKELRSQAKEKLESAQDAARIAFVYAAVIVGASLAVNLIRMLLTHQISQYGGLSNMGLRSILSTVQTMLPIILNFLLMCLGLGFTGTMLRISRGQYASLNSLKIGFARFWVLLRAVLLQGGLYLLAAVAAYMISMQIFFLTPLARGLVAVVEPAMQSTGGDILKVLENPAVLDQLITSMIPLYILMGVLFLAVAAPIYYRYRMVNYLILDEPRMGALLAMHTSRMLMRGNCMKYFKLDVSMWWYYAASILSLFICYGATILMLLGVEFSMSPIMISLIFFSVYLAVTFLITAFLQPHVEVVHALAYETLKPRPQPQGGVVLGNIFDLAREQNDQQGSL